ncbi:MAG: C4-type zinc ribbon domain-containing protein [Candidatus Omnitrophota bacterium]
MIKEQIDKLLKLQEVDLKILSLEKEKSRLPQEIKEMHSQESSINEGVKTLEEKLKQVQVEHKNKELDLQTKEGEIKKYGLQLYQVKTNKEYSSLQHQIEGLKADCSVIEDEIITVLDEIETVNKNLKQEKERQQQKINEFKQEEAVFKNRISLVDLEIETLIKDREAMVQTIDKEIYAKYDKILRGKGGAAIVPVVDSSCGGCNIGLPPQVINELGIGGNLIFCGNCARMLYLIGEDTKNE